jgi:hypothetical protein
MKQFAMGTSDGPNAVNFQLSFWRDSLIVFAHIKNMWNKNASVDYANNSATYTEDNFVVDAARGIIMAGTSISVLLGQNTAPDTNKRGAQRTKSFEKAACELGISLDTDEVDFVNHYDRFRHFGIAWHTYIETLDVDKYCDLMATAQSLWLKILNKIDMQYLSDDFNYKFNIAQNGSNQRED